MLKCPYCYEHLSEEILICPHCSQYIIDDFVNVDFPSLEKKDCIFCGKKIIKEARICRFCQKWLDVIDQAVEDVDPDDLV